MLRDERDADDYYRSKILSDRVVLDFLNSHPDFWAALVLPGWMHGPGDIGPTSAGQTVLDVAGERLPGVPSGSFSVVDARDVARAMILTNRHGQRGERYLAAGRHMTMADLLPLIAQATGAKAPTRRIPLFILHLIGAGNELYARMTGKPVLLSWAMARTVATENDRSRYDPAKSKRDLGLEFRPIIETLRDEVDWSRIRSTSCLAIDSTAFVSQPSSSTVNSSPPIRPMSAPGKMLLIRSATIRISLSPVGWP